MGVECRVVSRVWLEKWGFFSNFLRKFLPVAKFSTGMKRRLALARVESLAVKLWILDEPFIGLDQPTIDIINQTFNRHIEYNGMILFTSHLSPNIKNVETFNLEKNA